MPPVWTRRDFLNAAAVSGFVSVLPRFAAAVPAPFPVRFRKTNPYETLRPLIDPSHDQFAAEAEASAISDGWHRALNTRAIPTSADFRGSSPLPVRYREVAPGFSVAEFAKGHADFQNGLEQWVASLGEVRSARFFPLPDSRLRYEIAAQTGGDMTYRVGLWQQSWKDGRLLTLEPIEETLVTAPAPLFRDITSELFGQDKAFQEQLSRGIPYWRARLDSACGIDVYGNNGIAVGDIDADGLDEVYVCQPGGLPNRLYKPDAQGRMRDVGEQWGVSVLDDTTAALFLDLRNSGRQDLVVLTTSGPLLFLNTGAAFRHQPDAFHFKAPPQGTFTGMAAADYDRDGRVDLYLCTYVYFQSEDQYRYPEPYHDAQNGPPNFLFRNRLGTEGGGYFEDVTADVGLDQNNNHYSFASAWCDYDGNGWPDLYVANDFGRKNLYRNEGGRFRDLAAQAGVEDLGPGMSASWFDYDSDGRPDLYVANMWSASGQRVAADPKFVPATRDGLGEAYRRHTKGNSLYRNLGDGTFQETGGRERVEMGRWGWSAGGFDFDNDGSPEIYCTCGMLTNASSTDGMSFFWRQVVAHSPPTASPAPAYENGWNAINQFIREDYCWNGHEPNVMYARRSGRYYDVSGVSGIDFAEDSRAFAVTDFDGDGNLDILLKSRLGPQVRALRNEWGTGFHSLAIALKGTRSNRDAIGAAVIVEWAGKRTIQFVEAGSGYLSQHSKTLHFGLGSTAHADRVEVRWPSGLRQECQNLDSGFRYRLTEGESECSREPFRRRRSVATAAKAVSARNDPGFDETWLLLPIPIPEKRRGPSFLLLTSGTGALLPPGIPGEVLDLTREAPDVAAGYALFRRYLFDYRSDLLLPMLILLDERGLARKVYPGVPDATRLKHDLQLAGSSDLQSLALPFAGRYYTPPRRNYFRLGSAFFWAGYPEQALLYLSEVVRQEPDNGKAHLAIGYIHQQAGRPGEARVHLERAVSLLPENPNAWIYLGRLELAGNRNHEALTDFEKALSLTPDLPFALMSAGQAYTAMGDDHSAEGFFRQALIADPKDADAADQLGLLLVRRNRPDEARDLFKQAIAAQHDHVWAINNLGVLYMQMQKVDDALAAFRYGIEVAPDEDISYLNLARVYARAGDRAKAREIVRQLLARKPQSAAGLKALRELTE